MNEPVFILAPPRSYTSVVCAMLGQHPEMYGLPEVNLLVAESMSERQTLLAHPPWSEHGLRRAVAELFTGRQTPQTIAMAERWIGARSNCECSSVMGELIGRAAPRTLVDKSPRSVMQVEYLYRAAAAFPGARFVHLTRHPRSQGRSLWNMGGRRAVSMMPDALDHSTDPPTPDPQKLWYRMNVNIVTFLAGVPTARKRIVRGEEFLADPAKQAGRLAKWLGLRTDDHAVEAMMHPEESPFASLGPRSAVFGNDPSFLRDPVLREWHGSEESLDGPLEWRFDRQGFTDEVKALAQKFGYR